MGSFPCLRVPSDIYKWLISLYGAGSTFEIVVVACSRAGVNKQVFIEDSSTASTINLQQPVTGHPVGSCLLPGTLSMQVVLEECLRASTEGSAAAAGVTPLTGSEDQQ